MVDNPENAQIQKKGCQALVCLANHQDPLVAGEMRNDYRQMVIDAQGLVVVSEVIRIHRSNEDVYFAAVRAMAVLLPDLQRCSSKNDDDDDDISSISQSKSSYEVDSIISSSSVSDSSSRASRISTDVSMPSRPRHRMDPLDMVQVRVLAATVVVALCDGVLNQG